MSNESVEFNKHIFLFPFIWENDNLNANYKKIKECFESNNKWKKCNYKEIKDDKKAMLDIYPTWQYYHPSVRDAIFGIGGNIVNNYLFNLDEDCNKYIIEKSNDKYALDIDRIFVKVFNTGVAILGIECSNGRYNNLEDIFKINDYGRRIYLPFIPDREDGKNDYFDNSICADKLTIQIGNKEFSEDFRNNIVDIYEDSKKNLKLDHIAEHITGLLEYGTDFKFDVNNEQNKHNHIMIYPALDDRMYVMCFRGCEGKDGEPLLCDLHKENSSAYAGNINKMLVDNEPGKNKEELYKFAYIDATDCSCQFDSMRDELLKKHTYDRWIKYGTRNTITAQAFNIITSFKPNEKTFAGTYKELCILTLLQRATLINLQNQAQKLCSGMEVEEKGIKTKDNARFMDLQERFIAFEQQINFCEVTSQEQGIEIYQMLRDANFIDPLHESICKQLELLYDAVKANQDFNFNKWAFVLAIIAIIVSVAPIENIANFIKLCFGKIIYFVLIVVLTMIFIALPIYIIFWEFNRKRK